MAIHSGEKNLRSRGRSFAIALVLACVLGITSGGRGDEGATAPDAAKPTHRGAIITIYDEINDITYKSMKRRVDEAVADGANVIIFEMNTPGGLVSSALDICKYIKKLTDVKTIAWVNQDAYSAGAMISLACDEVVMTAASKIGDCAPIIITSEGLQELGETERAKAESPILKEFLDSASRNGYEPLLCEAMVRLGYEVWWMEDGEGGRRDWMLKADKEKAEAEEGSKWRPIKTIFDPVAKADVDLRQPVVQERDLLTLTQSEAVVFGFAKAIVGNEKELQAHYELAAMPERMVTNWAEGLADFLSSPLVRTILMVLIAMGVYSEFHAPGTFVGAAVAGVAMLIFLGAPYLTGLADFWEILLVIIGVVLLAVEILVIPGFGVAGIAGILLLLVGFIATFIPAEPGPMIVPRLTAGTMMGLATGVKVIFGGLGLSLVGMYFLNKYLPSVPGARGLFQSPSVRGAASVAIAGAGASPFPIAPETLCRVGDCGTTTTKLRPAGKATINGKRLDVITTGQMVESGVKIEVVEIEGVRIVVRPAADQ